MDGVAQLKTVFGRYSLMIWLAAILIGGAPLVADLQKVKGININNLEVIGRDFVNIWHGGEMAGSGKADQVYDRDTYRNILKEKVGITGIFAYSYPPHMLAASIPFGWLSYLGALALWSSGTLALFWYAARPWLAQAGLPSWIILFFPATLINIDSGHFGFLIGALVLIGWWNARKRPLMSGAAFAVMTVKPHLGVLVPVLLAVYRCWKTVFWAGVGTVALVVASALFFGWDLWAIWIKSTLPFQASLIGVNDPTLAYLFMMPTVGRMAAQYGLSSSAIFGAQIGFAVVALSLLIYGWRRGIDVADLGLLSILVTFILLPYVFTYDMVAFDLAVLVLATRSSSLLSGWEKTVLGLTFLVPAIHLPMSRSGIPISPLLIMATLWILVRVLTRKAVTPQ